MTDVIAFWGQLFSSFSESYLQAALLLNIAVTTVLIFQNMLNYKRARSNKATNSHDGISGTDDAHPTFAEEPIKGSTKKLKADVETSRIDRAILMAKEGYSDRDIKNSLDIEPAYINILMQNYKSSKA